MADMQENLDAERHDRLRRRARDRLDKGAAPRYSGGTLSVDALQLLYQRASDPESAADARRLLHELQTHQVELDLLYEQLQSNEQETARELAHYKSLFELAPAACLVVSSDGNIIEGNDDAGVLFGEPTETLNGKFLGALLAPGQQEIINTLLGNTGGQTAAAHGTEPVSAGLPDGTRVGIRARRTAAGGNIMMILTEAATQTARS